ncbi:MAG TPA: tetratricopeptide repeat protein [Candidatus Saccharimonadales bacterium]|nr:tetratricopeptide repeat protein [Candidatus Saccharimonadales bacterium]
MEHASHKAPKTAAFGISAYIDNIIFIMWGIFFLAFPFIFTTLTTDPFVLPRQLILMSISIISLLFWGIKMIADGKTKLRRTPLDFPITLFAIFIFLSTIFSVNRIDSILAFLPFLLLIFSFIILVNIIRTESSILFLVSSLVIGGAAVGVLAIFSFLKLYILPMSFTHVQSFTPFGSLVEQGYYLLFLLPISLYFAYPLLKGNTTGKSITFSITSVFLTGGLLVTIIQLLTTQRPIFLPFETGFQTAFAAISQDANRIAQGFFFGSGFGTFTTDFTRFKQAPFNLNTNIWYLTFNQSSSFVLELLATTGLLGVLAYLFIVWRIVRKSIAKVYNPLFISLLIILILGFFLPFSFLTLCLFFFLLSLYICTQALLKPKEFFDFELHLVTLRKGLITLQPEDPENTVSERGFTKFVPISFLVIFILLAIFFGFFGIRYAISDVLFEKSLIAASQNNGNETYNNERDAINLFPYRDFYFRVFSQTNLALANALAQTNKDKLAKDTQLQQTMYGLIQQSISMGRNATTISPMTVADWQNLASIYRSLIGFGQNAESFSLLATQQAVALDSANPQEYIALGGLYYQLGQYDNAIREFQTAINLKPDFANAYYNLGHAFEQKGDLKSALAQYQNVESLVQADSKSLKQIQAEVEALQAKISQGGNQANNNGQTAEAPTPTPTPSEGPAATTQLPLNLNQPAAKLPTQKSKITIAPIQITPTPAQ